MATEFGSVSAHSSGPTNTMYIPETCGASLPPRQMRPAAKTPL